VKTEPRQRPENVKEQIVREKEFENVRLVSEQVAEFDYRPAACQEFYTIVVVKKNLSVEKGEKMLFEDVRYFFYITNDRQMTTAEVVRFANRRCNQPWTRRSELRSRVASRPRPRSGPRRVQGDRATQERRQRPEHAAGRSGE